MESQTLQDKAFLSWFSGFTDGEGSLDLKFVDDKRSRYHGYYPRFSLSLRADDIAILQKIKAKLGFGHVNKGAGPKLLGHPDTGQIYQTNPQVTFNVAAKRDCLKLVDIFTNHPLRSRKQAVFEVWAKAVKEYCKGKYKNQALLACYRTEMTELKKYQGEESIVSEIETFLRDNKQLEMFGREVK